jgi:hypothetical protein
MMCAPINLSSVFASVKYPLIVIRRRGFRNKTIPPFDNPWLLIQTCLISSAVILFSDNCFFYVRKSFASSGEMLPLSPWQFNGMYVGLDLYSFFYAFSALVI